MSRPIELLDRVYRQVRQRFFSQDLQAGRAFSRRKLAEELGVGQASVRAALDRLEGEGLIESIPQSGTRVRQVNAQEYHEIHDLRELIEPYAARRAAWWITAEQLAKLDEACEMCAEALGNFEKDPSQGILPPDYREAQAAEHVFHGTILAAAQNATAARLLDNLRFLGFVGFYARQHSPAVQLENVRITLQQHRAIVQAIRQGDGEQAEQFMRVHLTHARNRSQAGLPLAELRALGQH